MGQLGSMSVTNKVGAIKRKRLKGERNVNA
jgi:hypothetical protein